MAWIETTATEMDPDWVTPYVGVPGTLAHQLGPELICTRCHATNVQLSHVWRDIQTGARRWTRRVT